MHTPVSRIGPVSRAGPASSVAFVAALLLLGVAGCSVEEPGPDATVAAADTATRAARRWVPIASPVIPGRAAALRRLVSRHRIHIWRIRIWQRHLYLWARRPIADSVMSFLRPKSCSSKVISKASPSGRNLPSICSLEHRLSFHTGYSCVKTVWPVTPDKPLGRKSSARIPNGPTVANATSAEIRPTCSSKCRSRPRHIAPSRDRKGVTDG